MTTITSKGQVTVPKKIRDELGLQPGQHVSFIRKGGKIYLEAYNSEERWNALIEEVEQCKKNNNIKPLTNEEVDKAINSSSAGAAKARWKQHTDD